MTIDRLHPLATYVLLCTGTAGLWLGEAEQIPPYPLLVVLCSATAYLFTDRLEVVRLSRLVSNALGVAIILSIAYEFVQDATNAVLALAHFVVYLQVVKSFRPKQSSDYWMLYVMSILQMTIGCVVNRSALFGALLLGYVLLGLLVLALFSRWRHLRPAAAERTSPVGAAARGPLRGLVPLVALWLASLPLALLFFWLLPRRVVSGETILPRLVASGPTVVGFSNTVSLDEMTEVLESDDVAFNVWCRDQRGADQSLPEEMRWRGMVYTDYAERRWQACPRSLLGRLDLWQTLRAIGPDQLVLEIEQIARTGVTIFCPMPFYGVELAGGQGQLQYIRREGRLALFNETARRQAEAGTLRYQVVTARGAAADPPREDVPSAEYLRRTGRLPQGMERMRALAATIVGAASDSRSKIERVRDYLNGSGRYGYTLSIRPVDIAADPIEDFLVNRLEGHCEYFASAAALLLRAVGVPTRLVNGFVGASFNQAGGFYQVRQMYAHTWVEAYVAEEGRWVTLDPTPSEARRQIIDQQRSWLLPIKQLWDAASRLWLGYIVSYDEGTAAQAARTLLREWLVALSAGLKSLTTEPANAIKSLGWPWWGTVLVLFVAGRCLGPVVRWLWKRFRRGTGTRRRIRNTPAYRLYQEWTRLLARRRLVRSAGQTPLEFARELQRLWSAGPLQAWADLPDAVVQLHYRDRYSSQTIDAAEIDRLRNRLHEFGKRVPGAG